MLDNLINTQSYKAQRIIKARALEGKDFYIITKEVQDDTEIYNVEYCKKLYYKALKDMQRIYDSMEKIFKIGGIYIMKNLGLDGVKEMEDFKAPEAGGYIGIIKNVFDNTDKGQLEIELDIAEGEYANYYEQLMAAKGFWGLKAYKNYENKKDPSKDEYCKRYFKSFITAVENSNEGYNFVNTDYNEKTLIGKK